MEYLVLLFVSFLSATFIPMGSEAFFIYYLSLDKSLLLLLLAATIGNTLGSGLNYWFGLKGEEYLVRKRLLKENKIKKAKSFFDRYGAYTLLFSWAPLIGDAVTFIAGVLKYDIKRFYLIVAFAKFARYLFVGFVYLYFK